MMKPFRLNLTLSDEILINAYEKSCKVSRIGGMSFRKPDEFWNDWFTFWFHDNFQMENLESDPKFSFLETAPNRMSKPHVDILKYDMKDGRGKRTHVRLVGINIVIPESSGHFEYVDDDGGVLSIIKDDGFSVYKTDIPHRSNNEGSDIPRRIFSIGLYKDSYEKLVLLDKIGALTK